MTNLAATYLRRQPARGLDIADRIGIAIAALAAMAALALAAAEILGDTPSGLPSLIPLDQPAVHSNFTA